MPSPSAHRVTGRFPDRTATLIFQDPERDLHWGWFASDAPPRMHLTLVSSGPYEDCIVWLEDRGRRICSARRCPSGSTIPLARWVAANRASVEKRWLSFMETKGWLSTRVEQDQLVVVYYPGQPTEFVRPIAAPVWTDRELRSP